MFATWCWIVGVLLIGMGLMHSLIRHLPISAAALYLAVGAVLGPLGFGMISLDLTQPRHAAIIEMVCEMAVLISLFAVGLRLRVRIGDPLWRVPVRLATLAMVLTIAMLAASLHYLLGLPVAAALLVAAILAPTDPVLATEVQVEHTEDRDRLRFSLTGEGGLNDGAAFPFVMLALGLMGAHELGTFGGRWLAVDVLWATAGGLAAGWLLGGASSRTILWLRRRFGGALGLESFFTIGLIGLTYGIAVGLHTYGFLAVFAAGLAMRQVEYADNPDMAPAEVIGKLSTQEGEATAVSRDKAAAYLAWNVSEFTLDLERLAELSVMVVIGSLIGASTLQWQYVAVAIGLIVVMRPVAVYLTTMRTGMLPAQRNLTAWFGIRGIGSIYYLCYALTHGVAEAGMRQVIDLTLCTVLVSVVLHGSSATPLMKLYRGRRQRRRKSQTGRSGFHHDN